ncbi:PvdJ/PvdD/PvdP-like protein [Stutzerimonas kirkiae]|uniref:pyoverdine maturation tyrosinase PvdP n=1 Tax=Stutzerimonas kirkiae TaxID=2211392 RepID=UPI0013F16043|nr:PvdJ/PvdD/PvdP-like protein [Stutzerimonas kirkiae]
MRVSRRKFVAGLAAAGVAGGALVAVRSAYRSHEEKEAAELREEPEIIPVPQAEVLLGERLVGIWDFRLLDGQGDFPGLALDHLELLLDIGPGGRAVRGVLGRRPFDKGNLQVFGELDASKVPNLRWKLTDYAGHTYDCQAIFDEIWGDWSSGGGQATISGALSALGQQHGFSTRQARFVAVRRPFMLARERLPYRPELKAWLISPGHRLFHQLWHAARDRWRHLDETQRRGVRALGWQPGPEGQERDARGKERHRNGSGEDFLFMHRDMVLKARAMQPLLSWPNLPPPRPYIGHGVQAFIDYVENHDGYSTPPFWEIPGDDDFNAWLLGIKSSEGYFGNFQLWEAQYQNPEYLSTLCLGELGSRIELGIHDWLHMCWASLARDPNSGLPMPYARNPVDFSERWFREDNDFLGDAFSSHVNPVFWAFHGWIDDRIEDWFLAHEQAHPGEVVRTLVDGVPWFAPGRWVELARPWLGPPQAGCGAWLQGNGGGGGELDIETMKLALRIIHSDEMEVERLSKRIPRRPWYGRHLPPGPGGKA